MCVFKYHAFIFCMRPPRWRSETIVLIHSSACQVKCTAGDYPYVHRSKNHITLPLRKMKISSLPWLPLFTSHAPCCIFWLVILTSTFSLSFPFLPFLFHIFPFFLVAFSHFPLRKTSANISLWEWGKFPIHKNTCEGLAHDHHGLNLKWQAYTLSQKQGRFPRI